MKKIIISLTCIFLNACLFAQTDSTATDSLLLLQIQNQMQQNTNTTTTTRSAASANPDISVIGDFRGNYQSNYSRHINAELHEAEFSFQSVVDPYARADFFVSLGHNSETGNFEVDLEEGYLTTLSLPAHLQLKAGKFKQMLGKINTLHPHAMPFVDMPNVIVKYFGEEGLNDEGLQLSWLLPNHSFYQELTFAATAGPNESPSFERSTSDNFMYLAHLKNFWDLTPNATLELGLTGNAGPNKYAKTTTIGSVDLTYKWKPVQMNTYKSFAFQNEFFYSHAPNVVSAVNSIGLFSMITTQISKRYFLTGRYDYTNKPESNDYVEQAGSLSIGWYATEFQKIELQGKYTSANEEDVENNYSKSFASVYLRWIFVIGSHGAHQY